MRFVVLAALFCITATACASGSSASSATSAPSATAAAEAPTTSLPVGTGSGTLTFHGFTCKSTCLGHERGYEWAEEHDIDDPHTCYSGPRLSNPDNESFSEGCEAYVDDSTGAAPLDPSERYAGVGAGEENDDNN